MDIAAEVRQRFGSRYAGIWYGGSTLFVAVVDRSAADQDVAAEIPHMGADIEVVSAQFSEAALTEFRDAVVQIMADGRQLAAGEPRVFGVGFGVHNNDFSSAGRPVVSVLVSDLDPDLLSRIRTPRARRCASGTRDSAAKAHTLTLAEQTEPRKRQNG